MNIGLCEPKVKSTSIIKYFLNMSQPFRFKIWSIVYYSIEQVRQFDWGPDIMRFQKPIIRDLIIISIG